MPNEKNPNKLPWRNNAEKSNYVFAHKEYTDIIENCIKNGGVPEQARFELVKYLSRKFGHTEMTVQSINNYLKSKPELAELVKRNLVAVARVQDEWYDLLKETKEKYPDLPFGEIAKKVGLGYRKAYAIFNNPKRKG